MGKKDAIIILGGGLNSDNSLPDISRFRAEKALELFNESVADSIVISGGSGFLNVTGATQTEASVIRDFLVSKGVSGDVIFLEERSKDTVGNAYFLAKDILVVNGWHNVVVITSEYHLPRTEYCFAVVLGDDYQIECLGIDSRLDQEELRRRVDREGKILDVVKMMTVDVKKGDLRTIEHILLTKHPAYSENPEISKEDLMRMIV